LNVFNRIFSILMLLLLIIVAAVILIAPHAALASLSTALAEIDGTTSGQIARMVAAGLFIVVCVALLYLEVRRHARSSVLVGTLDGATAELSIDSIVHRIRKEVMSLVDVRQVNPIIIPKRNGVDALVTVFTSSDVDVPAKAAEVGQLVRQQMEQRMGLRVGQIRVNIRHESHSADSKAVKSR
jgi:uncharacterized alkaline shock family protein YloU